MSEKNEWKLVPVEPTPEMRKAAADAWLDCGSKLFLNKAASAARAAIAAAPAPTHSAPGDALALPELNADLIDILGRPNFTCIRIAQLLRLGGVEIATKAEAEQATVIHYLLNFYLKHGSKWAEIANEDLKQRHAAALAAQVPQQGEA